MKKITTYKKSYIQPTFKCFAIEMEALLADSPGGTVPDAGSDPTDTETKDDDGQDPFP